MRLEGVCLAGGLRVLLHRDTDGDLVIYVSDALDAKRQRAAVVEAIRASRRTGWQAGLPPAGIALFLAARSWLGRSAKVLRPRPPALVPPPPAIVAGPPPPR